MTEDFKKALLDYLVERGEKAQEVLAFRQVEEYRIICGEGTCWGDYLCVRIYFIDNDNEADWYDYEGSYVDFMRDLTGTPDYMLD